MSGRAPAKPNFLHTCNLLGKYLHGKVSLKDLSLGIGSTNLEAPGRPDVVCGDTTTMDFLGNMEKSSNKLSQQDMMISGGEHKTAQLTIFYSGKLMVFDDFPADKARAVVLLASKGCSPQAAADSPPKPLVASPLPLQHAGSNNDLPIARRSSLHRFLEKRKDRATARAPYQMHNNQHPTLASSSKNHPSFSSKNEDELLDLNFKL